MKKNTIIVLVISVILCLTACQTQTDQTAADTASATQDTTESSTMDEETTTLEEETEAETETTVPEPLYIEIGDTVRFGHWDVTIESCDFVGSVTDQLGERKSDENETFALLMIHVFNNDKVADKFIATPYSTMRIEATLSAGEDEAFKTTSFHFTERDGGEKWVNPLSSHYQKVVFKLPNAIAEGEQELILQLASIQRTETEVEPLLFRIR